MNITSITSVYFSPTGTTQKVLQSIAEGLEPVSASEINLTLPAAEAEETRFQPHDLLLIGVPVYAGRIPATAVKRLQRIKGDKTPVVIVVVYGNREYEDALLELADLVGQAGFIPVAAGTFIGEHSYSTKETPIAVGRPDSADLTSAKNFGAAIKRKLATMSSVSEDAVISLPGNYPYKEYGTLPPASPVIVEDLCNLCGECAAACPTAAIAIDSAVVTDKAKCILCCACVKCCPVDARIMSEPFVRQIAQWLSVKCRDRKTPETFV